MRNSGRKLYENAIHGCVELQNFKNLMEFRATTRSAGITATHVRRQRWLRYCFVKQVVIGSKDFRLPHIGGKTKVFATA